MEDPIGVPEVFIGKNVFITGGTGFMGKMLIEKLLRSCPGINKIYVLMRERRGKTIPERLEEISKLEVFEKLHKERPGDYASKVIPISGNVCELSLGLSRSDRRLLIEEIHIIYHVAATVKFDQALKDAILMNMRGTREVCTLALDCKHIQLMVHISTAYAHTNYNPIEETMYPATADWRKMIKAAERLDSYEISKLQALILGPFPNTYTFTKGLGERIVYDTLNGRLANLIIRPSIVISTWHDPIPGWIDNFNGPVGMLAANGTGLVRINLVKNITADFVPVDIAIRGVINATWNGLARKDPAEEPTTTVHNVSANKFAKTTTFQIAQMAYEFTEEAAVATCVWYPTLRRTQNLTIYNIYFLLLHVFPALFFDSILRILKIRPVVLMIQRRIFVAVNALKFFILNEWQIKNTTLHNLEYELLDKDQEDFAYRADSIDHRKYFQAAIKGGTKYLLRQDMTKLKENRKRIRILKYVDIIVTILWYGFLFNLLFIKWNIVGAIYGYIAAYLESFPTPLLVIELIEANRINK